MNCVQRSRTLCVCMGINQFMVDWLWLSLAPTLKIVSAPLPQDIEWSLCNPTSFFTLSNTVTTRGHHHKLFKLRSRLLVRHNFFTNRVVSLWNSLPADVISAPTVALFKKNLDDLWRTTGYGHSQRPTA